MAGEFIAVFDELLPLLPQDSKGNPELKERSRREYLRIKKQPQAGVYLFILYWWLNPGASYYWATSLSFLLFILRQGLIKFLKVSLSCWSWPQTCSPPVSAQLLGLHAWPTEPSCHWYILNHELIYRNKQMNKSTYLECRKYAKVLQFLSMIYRVQV